MADTRTRAQVSALFLIPTFFSTACLAQDEYDEWLPVIEIVPYAGYRIGGDFEVTDLDQDIELDDNSSYAIALDFPIDPVSSYELFYGRQETNLGDTSPFGPVDVDIEYLHVGGTLLLNEEQPLFRPFIMGGLGVTRFTPDSNAAVNTEDETRFSMSLGAGVRVPFSDHFALRLEVRGFVTFLDTDSSVFCASGDFGGVCRVRSRGDAFFQYEFLAGAAFAF